jgi:hypothetical protein
MDKPRVAGLEVRIRLAAAAVAAVVLPAIAGCCCMSDAPGFSYDKKAYETWAKLERGLNPTPTPVDVEQTGVTIQRPTFFDAQPTNILDSRGRFEPGKQQPITEAFALDGLQPPMVKLPGLKFTYEMFYPTKDGKKLPVYCYLCTYPPGEAGAADVKNHIQTSVTAAYPQARWQEVKLEGSTFPTWQMSIGGTQAFHPKEAEKAVEAPGTFELYMVSATHANVLVGFRAPQDVAEQLSLDKAAKASVASIKSEKPAQPTVPPPAVEAADLKTIGVAFHSFVAANSGRAPQTLTELASMVTDSPKTLDHLRAGRLLVYYGVAPVAMRSGTSKTILGYEKNAPTSGGLVLFADGSVRPLTADAFEVAPKARP